MWTLSISAFSNNLKITQTAKLIKLSLLKTRLLVNQKPNKTHPVRFFKKPGFVSLVKY